MEELIIGDKTYVSSKRASEITGYAKDYVGQLCREGRVQATLVGRSWYVLESSIREHRFGAPEATVATTEEAVAPGIGLTWSPPVYTREEVVIPPESVGINALDPLIKEETEAEIEQESTEEASNEVIEQTGVLESMQSAWQDWFKTRSERVEEETDEAEPSPEAQNATVETSTFENVEETQEEVGDTAVTISMIEEPIDEEDSETIEEDVPLTRFYRKETLPVDIYVDSRETQEILEIPRKNSYVMSSLIVVVAGIAMLVAVIGSGKLDFIAKQGGIQAGTIYYFSGTDVIK